MSSEESSSSGGESGQEEFQESELKKKVLELDTENKNLKKRLDNSIRLFGNSKEEMSKMSRSVDKLKSQQKKLLKRSKSLQNETNNLKQQLEQEKSSRDRLKKEIEKKNETISTLKSAPPKVVYKEVVVDNPDAPPPPEDDFGQVDPIEKIKIKKIYRPGKEKIITKTVKKVYRPIHGIFLGISMIVEFSFWLIATFFYVTYFAQLREMFDTFNFRTGFGIFIILYYIVIAFFGFCNTISGIFVTITIVLGWSWCSRTLLVMNLFFSAVTMVTVWICFFISFILSFANIIDDWNAVVNVVFLLCHIVLCLFSCLCILWVLAIIFSFFRETDGLCKCCCGACCYFIPIRFVFKKLGIAHYYDYVANFDLWLTITDFFNSIWNGILGLGYTAISSVIGGKGKGRKRKRRKKKGKKKKSLGSDSDDSDEALELDDDDEGFDFERDSGDEELVFE